MPERPFHFSVKEEHRDEKPKAWLEREQEQPHRLPTSSQTLLAPTRPRTPQLSGAERVKSFFMEYFGVIAEVDLILP